MWDREEGDLDPPPHNSIIRTPLLHKSRRWLKLRVPISKWSNFKTCLKLDAKLFFFSYFSNFFLWKMPLLWLIYSSVIKGSYQYTSLLCLWKVRYKIGALVIVSLLYFVKKYKCQYKSKSGEHNYKYIFSSIIISFFTLCFVLDCLGLVRCRSQRPMGAYLSIWTGPTCTATGACLSRWTGAGPTSTATGFPVPSCRMPLGTTH